MIRAWIYLTCVSCLIVVCHSYGILTRRMIRTSGILEDELVDGGKKYEPVTLVTKEELDLGESNSGSSAGISARSIQEESNSTILDELTTVGVNDDEEDEDEEEEDDDDEETEEDDSDESEEEEVEDGPNLEQNQKQGLKQNQTLPFTTTSITLPLTTQPPIEEPPQLTSSSSSSTGTTPEVARRRTRLYPVARLWERTSPDVWSILSAAVSCLWSGLGMDCFTFRVVPMVKSMISGYPGYPYPIPPSSYTEFQPFYLAPRKDETDNVEGRRRRHNHLLGMLKLFKGALAGAIGLKTLLLPVLAGLALVAGKSLFISLASVILSAAAAWTGIKSYADRRLQSGITSDGHHAQFYMMR